jgi:hypothetical protein
MDPPGRHYRHGDRRNQHAALGRDHRRQSLMRYFLYFLGAWIFSSAMILLVLWIGALKVDRRVRKQKIIERVNDARIS